MCLKDVIDLIKLETGFRNRLVSIRPTYLRALTVTLDSILPSLPISVYWIDYLAVNRTTALDTLPRAFNLMPSRISQRLAYLRDINWRAAMFRTLFRRRR